MVTDGTEHKDTINENTVLFQINGDNLPPSEAFTNLRRTNTYNNSDWAAVFLNLRKSWRQWVMILRVLKRTGAPVWAWGAMYKAVAHSVILYGSKS